MLARDGAAVRVQICRTAGLRAAVQWADSLMHDHGVHGCIDVEGWRFVYLSFFREGGWVQEQSLFDFAL